jgi:hypothetical protein
LHGAQGHLVVLGEDARYVRVGLQDILRHVESLGSVEVGTLAGDDLDGALCVYSILEALSSVACRVGAGSAFELGDAAAAE